MAKELQNFLNEEYKLDKASIDFYRENGYIKLKNVLSPEVIQHYGTIITDLVIKLNTLIKPMEERTTYEKAFLQVWNLWRHSDEIKEFVFSKRLAKIAAELIGVNSVRLYHDQALYKESGGGITPWHADQHYWPLSNNNTATIWIPLQETPMEMGPLAFAEKSHQYDLGRNLEISDESEENIYNNFQKLNLNYKNEPFDLGEVSFHSGWTFHNAGANKSGKQRKVMTMIYMDGDIRLTKPSNPNQQEDREKWCPGIEVGEIVSSPINPVLYTAKDYAIA